MSEALSEWLRLREAADHAARPGGLVRQVADSFADTTPVHVLDLATGTGSNLRYLAERLPRRQRWLVVDRDPALLAELPVRLAAWADARGFRLWTDSKETHVRSDELECDVETRCVDLCSLDAGLFDGRQLVTASALLDLVSGTWLRALAAQCRRAGATALFAITYDGRSSCDPPEPEDEMVRALLNLHQKRDKGLGGPAEGPDATAVAERSFVEARYRVESAPSDWAIAPAARAFQQQLVEGWAGAAVEVSPEHAAVIEDWRRRRLDHIRAGRSQIAVGHRDLAAWPTASTAQAGAW